MESGLSSSPTRLGAAQGLSAHHGGQQVNKGRNGDRAVEEVVDTRTQASTLALAAVSSAPRKVAEAPRGAAWLRVAQPGSR